MDLPDDTRAGLLANVAPGDNSPALTRQRAVGRAQAHDRECVRPGPRPRRDQRVQAPCVRPLLFQPEGRERLHRRGDLADAAPARSRSGPRTAPRSSRPASSPPIRAGPNTRSSSSGWSWRARGRCSPCSKSAARRLPPKGCSTPARKRKLPFLPRVIGVVTSPTGAVIRDILHRLEDRCPTRVILWPVPVQGEGAAAKIAAAIRGFPSLEPRPDLLIVARGGGSIEDLWAFNEEEVVRAAAECPIPLISAVGHETDTTLIDFASDLRAPTPTAAAEIAVPVRGRAVRPARRASAPRAAVPVAADRARPRAVRPDRLPLARAAGDLRAHGAARWTKSASGCRARSPRAPEVRGRI